MTFSPFPKIRRIFKDSMIITEKIDGTNAQVYIDYRANLSEDEQKLNLLEDQAIDGTDLCVLAGSRNKYITPDDDNYGFSQFVKNNAEELLKLGPGRHFGEWWAKVFNEVMD